MKQRWQAAGLAALVTVGSASMAQADLSVAVRTAGNAEQNREEINAYVSGLFSKIAAGDKKSDSLREELCRQVVPTNILTPSASFTSEYVRAVLSNLPTMAKADDVQKRLVGAIILYNFCGSTPANNQLADAVQRVMADKSPAVALWGVKAAGELLPQLLRQQFMLQSGVTLAKGVLSAVKAYPTVGPLVQDAYNAFYLPDPGPNDPPVPPFAFGPCIDAMNQLMAMRSAAYRAGMPAYPQADRVATGFFTRGVVSSNISRKQRVETVTQMVILMAAIADQAASAQANDLADINKNVAACAGVLNVSLLGEGNPAAVPLRVLAGIKANAPATNLTGRIADAVKAIQGIPDYKSLSVPAAAPAAPTTAPAAGG